MTDCGTLFNQITQLQNQIDSDNADLQDPNFCDGFETKQACADERRRIEKEIGQLTQQINHLDRQLTFTCNVIFGTWQINGNGSQGQLNITSIDSNGGSFNGTVAFVDTGRTDNLTGTWDDATGQILFTRLLPILDASSNNITQIYQGFSNLHFVGAPENLWILAGFLIQSDIPRSAPRTQFGWFATK